MAKKFDKVIVIDLEATCWDETTPEGLAEKGDQESEIIEFGCCVYYPASGKISNKKSIYVRPTISTISKYCTDLTGITPEFIKKEGIPYSDALNRLKKEYGPKHRVMASWGNYDWYMISNQCLREDLFFPFGRSHINIKELHALKRRLEKALGLSSALEHEKMTFEGRQHCGADDAYNAARIYKVIMEG